MIEPQNTMLPFAPAASAKEQPVEGMGFGEMLAQTLGMVPRFDPTAITGMLPDQGQGETADDGEAAPGDHQAASRASRLGAPLLAYASRHVPVTPPTDTVVSEQLSPVVKPVVVDDGLPIESGAAVSVPTTTPTTPSPVEPAPVDVPAMVGDEIGLPVLDKAIDDFAGGAAANENHAPAVGDKSVAGGSPDWVPVEVDPVVAVPKPEPPAGDLEPIVQPAPMPPAPPIVSDPAPAALEAPPRRATPSELQPVAPEPVPTVPAPSMPEPPVATSTPAPHVHLDEAVQAVPAQSRIRTEAVPPRDSGRIVLGDSRVELEAAPAPMPAGPSLSVENTTGRPTPVSNFATPAAPTQHTALAERVLEAVQLQANQPPPRTMIVDLPEMEGLRLVVSVRAGAEVHVVPTSSSTGASGLQGFMNELDGVLAERGFVMTGDGRRRGGNPNQEPSDELPRRPRPAMNRPTDNDLRI